VNFFLQPAGARHDLPDRQTQRCAVSDCCERFFAPRALDRLEKRRASRISRQRPSRQGVQHHASANRDYRRKLPHDEPVSRKQQRFVLQTQMR
jgi:hypothetical protein